MNAVFLLFWRLLPYYFAGPPPDYRCTSGPQGQYCLFDPPYGVIENTDSVICFSSQNGSDFSWRRLPISRVFYAEFRRRGLKAPQVIGQTGDSAIPQPECGGAGSRFAGSKRHYQWTVSSDGREKIDALESHAPFDGNDAWAASAFVAGLEVDRR